MAPAPGADAVSTQQQSKSRGTFEGMELNSVGLPVSQGLYNPEYEKDACGVGFIVNIDGLQSRKVSENVPSF